MRLLGFARAVFTSEVRSLVAEGSLQRPVRSEDKQAIEPKALEVIGESTLTNESGVSQGKQA
jgi:hypothetical protein